MSYANPNLMTAQDSSFEEESNHGNWVSGSGTTLTRRLGTPETGFEGVAALGLTPTEFPGEVSARCTRRIPIAVGAQHVAQMLTLGTEDGAEMSLRITYWDAASGGNELARFSAEREIPGYTRSWVGVCGEAPHGATHAELSVQGENLEAETYVDAFYFGVASTLPDNAYDYNTQSFEQDSSTWWAVNATAIPSKGADLPEGWGEWSAQVTASEDGDILFGTTDTFPVTPGEDYLGYIRAVGGPDTPVNDAVAELFFYDEDDEPIGDPIAGFEDSLTAYEKWDALSVSGTAPDGAVTGRVQYKFPDFEEGGYVYLDEAFFGVAPNRAGNLLTYGEYSFEGQRVPMESDGAELDYARPFIMSLDGVYARAIEPTSDIAEVWYDRKVPVSEGNTYEWQATLWVVSEGDTNAGITFQLLMEWFDGSGDLLLEETPDQPSATDGSEGFWKSLRVNTTRDAPANAEELRVGIRIHADESTANVYYLDKASVVNSTPSYELERDNASGSMVLTIYAEPSSGLGGYVRVTRVDEDGTKRVVRTYSDDGMLPFDAVPLVVEDYEAPLDTKVWYVAEFYDDDKEPLETTVTTLRTDSPTLPDGDMVWFKSPGMPAVNTRVMMEEPITWEREARSTTYQIVGRKNPVHISGTRAGRTGEASVLVWDSSAHANFDALLDGGLPALIQAMPGHGLPGNLYVSIGDVSAEPVGGAATEDGWRWTLALTEIDRPGGGVQGSALGTWQDVLDEYDRWDDVYSDHDTWAVVLTRG